MMASSRDLAFPLMIVCLVLIRSNTTLPTISGVPGTDLTRPLRPSATPLETDPSDEDDYSDDYPLTTVGPKRASAGGGTFPRCDYKPCLDNQPTCAELADSTSCLCPGITPSNVAPYAPNLRKVSLNGSEVVLQWCAPYSDVTAYVVMVGGQERRRFGKNQRSGAVGVIDDISEVCVVAVNDAGDSDTSCLMYRPRDNSLPLKAGLIGGALGFLLLLLLAVLLWRHKRQRKQEASISMRDAAESQ